MATPVSDSQDSLNIPHQKIVRDLKQSVGFLISGIAIYAIWVGLFLSGYVSSIAGSNSGNYILLANIVPGIGAVFTLIGAIFAGINWSMLRKIERPGAQRTIDS